MIIVDGYNYILRTMPVRKSDEKALERAREQLLRQMEGYAQGRRVQVVVVFDGRSLPGIEPLPARRGVRVLFSRAPQSADALIKSMIEKQKQPRAVTVVTSDMPLARFVTSCGAQHWRVEALRERLEQRPPGAGIAEKFAGPVSAQEVDEWLRLFDAAPEEE